MENVCVQNSQHDVPALFRVITNLRSQLGCVRLLSFQHAAQVPSYRCDGLVDRAAASYAAGPGSNTARAGVTKHLIFDTG